MLIHVSSPEVRRQPGVGPPVGAGFRKYWFTVAEMVEPEKKSQNNKSTLHVDDDKCTIEEHLPVR